MKKKLKFSSWKYRQQNKEKKKVGVNFLEMEKQCEEKVYFI